MCEYVSVYREHDILFLYPERSCFLTAMIIELPDHWKGVAGGWQVVFTEDFKHNWRKGADTSLKQMLVEENSTLGF